MSAKPLSIATLLIAAAASSHAIEATQFDDTPSTLTRAEVKAELARAIREGTWARSGEATVFADGSAAPRDRAEVRAEARAANRQHRFDPTYVGGAI